MKRERSHTEDAKHKAIKLSIRFRGGRVEGERERDKEKKKRERGGWEVRAKNEKRR